MRVGASDARSQRFVTRMLETTRALEKRTEAVARAADPVFNASSMTNMLKRSLSLKVRHLLP